MSAIDNVLAYLSRFNPFPTPTIPEPDGRIPGQTARRGTEQGMRTTAEEAIDLLYMRLEPNFGFRQTVLDIRDMDRRDPRVKKIHERTARAGCNGGLFLKIAPGSRRVRNLWDDFSRRLELNRREKLESDMRGAMMEGNLPIQWVLDLDANQLVHGLRMPTESIKPLVDVRGKFIDPTKAYEQWDFLTGQICGLFPLWQLNMVRIRPDNYDNWASFGRPYLDATRTPWRQLVMTEKDLVIRRHTRAPQRVSHILEGATKEDLDAYENRMKAKMGQVTTDFFSNRKGSTTALQGDANLDQIADVVHLLDTFFSGAPAPKGLFGYTEGLNRDILQDLKLDYYDELDALQDNVSFIYELGFRLELLLKGINPDADEMSVQYFERRTETPNQRADLALKHQALGVPGELNWRTAGLDPVEVQEYIDEAKANGNPYPGAPPAPLPGPRVSITPGNQPKGESATSVTN